MARAVSPKNEVKRLRFLILRSLFYNQDLPSQLVYGRQSRFVSSEMNALTELKLIKKTGDGLRLTDLGREYLYRLTSGRKPPMIDLEPDSVLPRKKRKEYIVRSSLAAGIFREVRNGE